MDNVRDALRKGRVCRGARVGGSVLNDAAVRRIRELDMTQDQIAKLFGVSQTLISQVKRRKIWAHVV